ncbi:MAG TPA: VWA domain-containing protein [Planctomycetaceae bacterium]|nr:VWA domain-containing protein [Planctomycetaceae bacterium]
MKFAEPLWVLAGLVACGALSWAWRRYDARQRAALATFASSHLHAQLTASFSAARRKWKRGLFLAALGCLFVALARPQAGFRWEEVKRRGIEVIFAVDTSRSMLTPDVKPDRLTRAKLAVDDFVSHLNGDGAGLIAFAGNAFLQCPITLDYEAFHESLAAIDTTIIPRGGTDIASAIREAQAALQNRPGSDKILVLLTDGEDLEGSALDAAKAAAKDGLKIYTVGVGTANGDLIPIPAEQGGGFVKDDAGQFVKSHLDEPGLKAIAEATGGLYAPLGAQGQGLETIYQQALAPLAKHDLASRRQKVYTERFQWPLAASLALLLGSMLLGTRRRIARKHEAPVVEIARPQFMAQSAAAMLGVLLFIPFSQAQASPAAAEQAYQKGDFATAEREYAAAAQHNTNTPDLQFNVGTAAYKAGQFPQAAEAFQKSLGSKPSADAKRLAAQEDAYYNLGDTLYRTGQKAEQSKPEETIQSWEQAVKTYDAALQLRADDIDAKYNRDFVKRKLEELKKKQEQKNKDEQKQKQDQKDKDQKNQSGQNSDQKNQQNKDQKPDDKNQSGQNSQAKDQEKKDQKPGANSKPDQQKDQQQANGGSKPDQQNPPKPDQQKDQQQANGGSKPDEQKRPDQAGQQPKPANGQPQGNNPAQAGADQHKDEAAKAADSQREPGQMSKDEARSLLDSLKDEERRLPAAPVARSGTNDNQPDQPIKDW